MVACYVAICEAMIYTLKSHYKKIPTMDEIKKPLIEGVDYTIIEYKPCGFTIIHHTEESSERWADFLLEICNQFVAVRGGTPITKETLLKLAS